VVLRAFLLIVLLAILVLHAQASFSKVDQRRFYGLRPFLSSKATSALPVPVWDEQLGETFTQDYVNLSWNVSVVSQTDRYGYGPAYLLNGLTNAGWWYQVGVAYDWPETSGGYLPGFVMVFEVFNSTGFSVFPEGGGGGALNFSTSVKSGDTILLELSFSATNVSFFAKDYSTGAVAHTSYFAHGSYFVGSVHSPSNQNGFFTGVMTEEYHVDKFFGSLKPVLYQSFSKINTAWLWADEYDPSNGTQLFYNSTFMRFNYVYELQSFYTDGAYEYAYGYGFVTGKEPISLTVYAKPVYADFGEVVNLSLTAFVQTNSSFEYTIYLDNTRFYSSFSLSRVLLLNTSIRALALGEHFYYVFVRTLKGYVASSKPFFFSVNPDPSLFVNVSRNEVDAGETIFLHFGVIGGTPPYTERIYDNRSLVASTNSSSLSFSLNKTGLVTLKVLLKDRTNYVSEQTLLLRVNPDPRAQLVFNRSFSDIGVPLPISVVVSGGTPPYSVNWYVNHTYATSGSLFYFVPRDNATYFVQAKITDDTGYTILTQALVLRVFSDPVAFLNVTSSPFTGKVRATVYVEGGTPPYRFAWYVNGRALNTSSQQIYLTLPKFGQNVIKLVVLDSSGYSITLEHKVNYQPYTLYILLPIVVLLLVLYLTRKKRFNICKA
jgi:hypothetical protein